MELPATRASSLCFFPGVCGVAVVILSSSLAFADPNFIISDTPARWYWEASGDNGATWVRDSLHVPASTTSVRVRGVCEFVGPSNTYFGGAAFDATYTGLGTSGVADDIPVTTVNRCQIANLLPQVAVTRWGPTLKIDYAGDQFPPGEGPYWWGTGQNAPFRGPHVSGNPLCAFGYTVLLDGTLGERRVDAIFAQEPFFGPGSWIRLFRENDFSEFDNIYMHPVEQHGLTLRVVPSPGTTLAACMVCLHIVRRRR